MPAVKTRTPNLYSAGILSAMKQQPAFGSFPFLPATEGEAPRKRFPASRWFPSQANRSDGFAEADLHNGTRAGFGDLLISRPDSPRVVRFSVLVTATSLPSWVRNSPTPRAWLALCPSHPGQLVVVCRARSLLAFSSPPFPFGALGFPKQMVEEKGVHMRLRKVGPIRYGGPRMSPRTRVRSRIFSDRVSSVSD